MDVLSLTGSSALWLALGIWVKSLTGSTAAAGMVIFAILAPPVLLAPVAGMLVDRVRRRPLLVTVNLANAAAVLLLLLVRSRRPALADLRGGRALRRVLGAAALRPVGAAAHGRRPTATSCWPRTARCRRSPRCPGCSARSPGPGSTRRSARTRSRCSTRPRSSSPPAGLALLRVGEPAPAPAEGHWRAEVGAGLDPPAPHRRAAADRRRGRAGDAGDRLHRGGHVRGGGPGAAPLPRVPRRARPRLRRRLGRRRPARRRPRSAGSAPATR